MKEYVRAGATLQARLASLPSSPLPSSPLPSSRLASPRPAFLPPLVARPRHARRRPVPRAGARRGVRHYGCQREALQRRGVAGRRRRGRAWHRLRRRTRQALCGCGKAGAAPERRGALRRGRAAVGVRSLRFASRLRLSRGAPRTGTLVYSSREKAEDCRQSGGEECWSVFCLLDYLLAILLFLGA